MSDERPPVVTTPDDEPPDFRDGPVPAPDDEPDEPAQEDNG
jgi:hypothetical protein